MLFGQPISLVWRGEQWKRRKYLPSAGPSPWGSAAMRQSFHHPALTTCGAPLPPGKKYVAVRYLSRDAIFFVIDVKGKGQDIFEDACKYLGLQDTELFGLAFIQDGEYIFIDPSLKISKYAVKSWKTTDFGIGGDGQPLLILYLRVKHYVDCHLLISEKVARHHYYLQLRDNVKSYSQPVGEEKAFVLAALALQADLGNYSALRHTGKYFDINNYFPSWIVMKIGEDYIVRNIPALHKDNVGLSRGEAQVAYIKEASEKTAPHNLHFYKMQRRKGKSWTIVWLGISDSGLHIYEQPESGKTKSLLSTFLWCDIAKLHFEKKKFEIVSEGSPEYRKFTYYVSSEELAKHLLWLCQSTHHFHMNNELRVQELKKLELDGGKYYRESYIYTDPLDMALHVIMNQKSANVSCQNLDVKGERAAQNHHRKTGEKGMCCVPSTKNRSMETLPLTNGYVLSPDMRYKSQSIACFPERLLTSGPMYRQEQSHLWNPSISSTCLSDAQMSTLLSQRSCASCTDSACSSLSLASGSKKAFDDYNQWEKCDSFEELTLGSAANVSKSLPHKVCISTFKDSHVRTASLYNATGMNLRDDSCKIAHSASRKSSNASSQLQSYHKLSVKPASSSSSVASNQIACDKQCQAMSKNGSSASRKPSDASAKMQLRNKSSGSGPFPAASKPLPDDKHMLRGLLRGQHAPQCRTATRIGISSLNREQRLPLSLYSGKGKIMACGSEPNLYNTPFDCDGGKLTDFTVLRDSVQNRALAVKKPNSRSEMCLINVGHGVAGNFDGSANSDEADGSVSSRESKPGRFDECDFPFIPPPPAYRNISEQETTVPTNQETVNKPHRELCSSASSPPDVLDIQQLRQKSQDMDLPLISALCNDRSLVMLPKTVPTCSRQRHLGNKDPLRFARGYSTTPPSAHVADFIGPMGRPATWHIESSTSPSSWFGSVPVAGVCYNRQTSADCPVPAGSDSGKSSLPPTILTSFGRTNDKCNSSTDSSYQSSDYRLNKLQMIPTKLLSGIVSNGKIHLKGSSS